MNTYLIVMNAAGEADFSGLDRALESLARIIHEQFCPRSNFSLFSIRWSCFLGLAPKTV